MQKEKLRDSVLIKSKNLNNNPSMTNKTYKISSYKILYYSIKTKFNNICILIISKNSKIQKIIANQKIVANNLLNILAWQHMNGKLRIRLRVIIIQIILEINLNQQVLPNAILIKVYFREISRDLTISKKIKF